MTNPLLRVPLPVAGLLALAVAMGIGRFAFTPILPLMQADAGLTLAQGGWLASANYLGYLVGALTITRISWSAETLLRAGLWLVVITTTAMGVDSSWSGWLIWRFLAGLASGWVMVSTAALCIARLTAAGKGRQSGIVFSGVGCGIMFAGLACMALALLQQSSARIWLWMGAAALAGLLGASMMWRLPPAPTADNPAAAPATAAQAGAGLRAPGLHWGLIICYGFFGFGYILPATFLPAQARLLIADPLVFGLTWPVFGLAAAVSTLISSRLGQRFTQLQIWAGAQVVMGVGVFLPVVWHGLPALIIAAICVGGTVLVITAAGLQEAQIVVGPATARKQMAAMTASFALGQLVGPLLFSSINSLFGASLEFALLLGALLLAIGIVPLLRLRRTLEPA
ncbi:MAG: YbfB/YjiJ family MFS transporter [Ottowia sp.]|nr:YbfB/YjiJ family MFS transporter [Ottowia sp.]